MTVERPVDRGEVWMVNAVMGDLGFYANHHTRAADVSALKIGPPLQVNGNETSPYGVYSISARSKDRPDLPALAAASVDIQPGRSYDAVLHPTPNGGYRMSIYENPFAPPSDAPSLIVRHVASAPRVAWRLRPKDVKPEIPVDTREGELAAGEWQMVTAVVQNDYRFEVLVDGAVVAVHPDLELQHEKTTVIHVGGDLEPQDAYPSLSPGLLEQELRIAAGPNPPATVTAPAAPVTSTDDNQPIAMTCAAVTTWQTHPATTRVSAVDPDGRVTDLSIVGIVPDAGGIAIGGPGVVPAAAIGEPATADIDIGGDLQHGHYDVTVMANREGMGARPTCQVGVDVRPITLERLEQVVDEHTMTGDIAPALSEELLRLLGQARVELDDGDVASACEYLKEVVAQAAGQQGTAITAAAATQLDREAQSLRADLGCG